MSKELIKDLPLIGMSRFSNFKSLMPFSREKFRQLTKAGKAPQPIRMGCRLTMYDNKELHRFIANPIGYSVDKS
jgi:predicted DNA-binding transcriptional regulator AlpA